MNARLLALAIAFVALVTLPYWMPGIYYINVASQILFYAIFALGLNVLVGYAGLVSLGHAGLFGIAAYATGYMLQIGYGHTAAILVALVVGVASMAVFAVLSLRSTGIGFIMITLALGEILWGLAYRWISLTGGDNGINVPHAPGAVRIFAVGADHVLLHDAGHFPAVGRGGDGVRALAVRRRADGHARPAAPHECARLSRLDDPLLGLPVLRLADRRVRHPVRLLHAVHQPADALAHLLGRGAADGDLRRPGTLLGPIVGAGLVVVVKNVVSGFIERWNFLLGAIFVAIVILMPEGLVPGTRAAVAAGVAQDERARQSRGDGGASHERAHRHRPVQVVRRPARHHQRQSQCRAGRAAADHRPQRRRQDHAVQPDHRRAHARQRLDPSVRAGHHQDAEPAPPASRHGAHLPDHHAVPARHHHPQRLAGAARPVAGALEPADRHQASRPSDRARPRGAGTGRPRPYRRAAAGADLLWRAPPRRDRHGAGAESESAAARRAVRRACRSTSGATCSNCCWPSRATSPS